MMRLYSFSIGAVLLLGFSFVFSGEAVAQERQNSIELGIPGLAFGNFFLNYERLVGDNQSAQISVGLGSSAFDQDNFSITVDDLDSDELEDFDFRLNRLFLNAQYRFYFGKRKSGMNGFYLAPYASYGSYVFDGSVTDESNIDYTTEDGERYVATQDVEYRTDNLGVSFLAAGGQMGVQWILGRNQRFVIDWYFLGLGFGAYRFGGDVTTDFTDREYYESLVGDIEADFSENDRAFEDLFNFETTNNSFGYSFWAPSLHYRTGLSLGIAF